MYLIQNAPFSHIPSDSQVVKEFQQIIKILILIMISLLKKVKKRSQTVELFSIIKKKEVKVLFTQCNINKLYHLKTSVLSI